MFEEGEDEEYFEDYTLPGFGEGVLTRQKSFRKKVYNVLSDPNFSSSDIVLTENEKILLDIDTPSFNRSQSMPMGLDSKTGHKSPKPNTHKIRFSTPKSLTPLNLSLTEANKNIKMEDIDIDEETFAKINRCLDKENFKDSIYLSGKLQDMLTPEEAGEVLANSHKYCKVFDEEVWHMVSHYLKEYSKSRENTPVRDMGKTVIKPAGISLSFQQETSIQAEFEDAIPADIGNDKKRGNSKG